MAIIQDGTGAGNSASVDNKNRLGISGMTDSSFVTASHEGKGFFIHSGKITLTSANKSMIIYAKNTSDEDIVISRTTIHLGASTGGSGNAEYRVAINPSSGTVLTGTDGVDYNTLIPFNNNLGKQSSDPFPGTARAGVEGTTAISLFGEVTGLLIAPGIYNLDSTISLPKGASVATLIVPPTGNTNMEVVIDYLVYFREEV